MTITADTFTSLAGIGFVLAVAGIVAKLAIKVRPDLRERGGELQRRILPISPRHVGLGWWAVYLPPAGSVLFFIGLLGMIFGPRT